MSNKSEWRLPDGRFRPRVFGLAALADFMLFAVLIDSDTAAVGGLSIVLALGFPVLLIMFLVRLLQAIAAERKQEATREAITDKAIAAAATAAQPDNQATAANALLELQLKQQQIATEKAKAETEQKKGCFWGCMLVGIALFVLGFLTFCGMWATEYTKEAAKLEQKLEQLEHLGP